MKLELTLKLTLSSLDVLSKTALWEGISLQDGSGSCFSGNITLEQQKELSLEGTPSMGVGDGATLCGHIDVATSFGQLSGR